MAHLGMITAEGNGAHNAQSLDRLSTRKTGIHGMDAMLTRQALLGD